METVRAEEIGICYFTSDRTMSYPCHADGFPPSPVDSSPGEIGSNPEFFVRPQMDLCAAVSGQPRTNLS
ncbi:unnamed protein product [Soboliphyme baturini]|uniref:Uncharacterized protein n=1 Tax=Soboliphyme baturini TaxID=241478 RepID=A0A183J230_9BILA|nr:unnamed protein product [Soboliphyme baturini]